MPVVAEDEISFLGMRWTITVRERGFNRRYKERKVSISLSDPDAVFSRSTREKIQVKSTSILDTIFYGAGWREVDGAPTVEEQIEETLYHVVEGLSEYYNTANITVEIANVSVEKQDPVSDVREKGPVKSLVKEALADGDLSE